jgi:hypothetical protein
MSVGSILHDRCCIQNPNGAMCNEELRIVSDDEVCGREWNEAWYNTQCSALPNNFAPRQWPVTFGPYYLGSNADIDEAGNFIGSHQLTAPPGQRINPTYQNLCQGGQCRPDSNWADACGNYCICQ